MLLFCPVQCPLSIISKQRWSALKIAWKWLAVTATTTARSLVIAAFQGSLIIEVIKLIYELICSKMDFYGLLLLLLPLIMDYIATVRKFLGRFFERHTFSNASRKVFELPYVECLSWNGVEMLGVGSGYRGWDDHWDNITEWTVYAEERWVSKRNLPLSLFLLRDEMRGGFTFGGHSLRCL